MAFPLLAPAPVSATTQFTVHFFLPGYSAEVLTSVSPLAPFSTYTQYQVNLSKVECLSDSKTVNASTFPPPPVDY